MIMKTLKKIILLAILMPLAVVAQDIFEKYGDNNAVTYVSIKPRMFQMLAKIDINTSDPEAQQYIDMVNSITSFKTLATSEKAIATDLKKWVKSKASKLEELMEVKDDGVIMKFYVKEGKDKDHVEELLMFVNGLEDILEEQDITINGKKRSVETVIVSLTGNIDLNQISKLTSKMNLPGGDKIGKTD